MKKDKKIKKVKFEEYIFDYLDFWIIWEIELWKNWNQIYFITATFNQQSINFLRKLKIENLSLFVEKTTIEKYEEFKNKIEKTFKNKDLVKYWFHKKENILENIEDIYETEELLELTIANAKADDLFELNKFEWWLAISRKDDTKTLDLYLKYLSKNLLTLKLLNMRESFNSFIENKRISVDKNLFKDKLYDVKSIEFQKELFWIKESAFENNKIEEIKFWNETVISQIDECAFKNNIIRKIDNLKPVEIIKEEAFKINMLKEVEFENIISIGTKRFESNSIEKVIFPKKVTTDFLGIDSFKHNYIKELILPEWLKVIPHWCFEDNKIQNLTLPKTLKHIEWNAFSSNNIVLNKLELPEWLESIGPNAFSMTKINWKLVIPNTVISIWNWAFWYCEIEEIEFWKFLKVIWETAFWLNYLKEITLPEQFLSFHWLSFNPKTLKKITFLWDFVKIDMTLMWQNYEGYDVLQKVYKEGKRWTYIRGEKDGKIYWEKVL